MEEENNLAAFEDGGVSELEAGCAGGEKRVVGPTGKPPQKTVTERT